MLEKGINGAVAKSNNYLWHRVEAITRLIYSKSYVAIIVLFAPAATGIFGAMHEGMTGDPNILIAKSFLDFSLPLFSPVRLASPFQRCAPMLIIQLTLAACATLILH
ncbi:DUF554 domain-containing protein [Salmonella enterica subsp. enterica]|nr:DUF554 domain-containing protein [Salmonella enterica subsp. enterica]